MSNKTQVLLSEIFGEGMLNKKDRFQRVFLNHVPVMITDSNKVLCLPNRQEMYHVGITAASSKGKGICGNTILGFEYWMKKRMCLILNDFQNETFENSLPCLNKTFETNLKIVNSKPIGYPIVYVYPSNKSLKLNEEEKYFPHIKMCIPTRVLIKSIGNYYKLDKAAKYITGYIKKFEKCKNLDGINNTIDKILEEHFPDKKHKGFEEMKFKISTIFKNIFDEEISELIHTDAYAFLNVTSEIKGLYNYSNLTIQSLFAVGLIPSVQTSVIRGKSWFSAYMSFIVESIYDDFLFRDGEYLRGKTLAMFVPEIDKLWRSVDNGELIKSSLSLVGTNGRRVGIGLIWDAQDYHAVPDTIRANTRFLFVLRKSDAEEVREIKKDFNVDKEVQNWILSLETDAEKGRFDCVALTTDKFVLYNMSDGKFTESNTPQKGRLITPLAHHKVPGRPLKDVIK